jgi:Protein of unknown function (DUF3467)
MPEDNSSQSPTTPDPQTQYTIDREEDFSSLYANNVSYEASVYDLKLLFGQSDLSRNRVELHTAMTIPWLQAKLMAHYIQMNVAVYEAENGKIKIPARMHPPELSTDFSEELQAYAARMRAELLAE